MSSLIARLRTPRAAAVSCAALVALAGLVLVSLGIAKATVWAPERVTVARVAGRPGVPVVTTTPDATALDGPALQVDVRGPAGRQVFVGVGRADDVTAYLGSVARTEVTGVQDGQGVVQRQGAEGSLPQPADVDVWAASATGNGSASLTWPQGPGRWRVVAAVDGATPPTEVVLTWQRARASSPGPALIAVGGLLLVLGLVGGWLGGRARPVPAVADRLPPAPERAGPAPAASVPPATGPGPAPASPSRPPSPSQPPSPSRPPSPSGPAARPVAAPLTRREARAAATGELPVVGRRAGVPGRGSRPWYDEPDEPQDDVAPAPFRQPPGERS